MSGALTMSTDNGDWPALARAAERFLADRLSADPRNVAADRLDAEAAHIRERVARAIVTIFTSVEQRQDIPPLDISYIILSADIAGASARVTSLARAQHDSALRAYAAALAMIAEHCQPREGQTTPAILLAHAANQHARAQRAANQLPVQTGQPETANAGGDHVTRSAAHAPQATTGRGNAHTDLPRPQSPGLFA